MSKATDYEAARVRADQLYPPPCRLRSVFNHGADYDASASVEKDGSFSLRLYGSSNDLTVSTAEALRLAHWILDTYADPTETRP